MEQFIAFLKENYRLLIECSAILVSVLILVFKKTKVNVLDESSLNCVIANLPRLIQVAERNYGAGHGSEKFKFVLKEAVHLLAGYSGLSEKSVLSAYGDTLSQQIEEILKAPQKKEKD